jgi:hypothetical protein
MRVFLLALFCIAIAAASTDKLSTGFTVFYCLALLVTAWFFKRLSK